MQSIGVRYGLLAGALVIVYFALLYALCLQCFLHPGFQWAALLLYGAVLLLAAVADDRQHGLHRTFRERVRTPFLAFVVGNVLYWLFYYTLHLADPGLLQAEAAQQIAYLRNQLQAGTGDPAASAKIREQLAYLEKEGMSMPLGPVVLQIGLSALGGFGLAAVSTLIASFIQPGPSDRT
ncbi:MAG: DUF4199 family protein [Saprospiraceae bacterium]